MNADPFDPTPSAERDDAVRQNPKAEPVSDLYGEPNSLDELKTTDPADQPRGTPDASLPEGADDVDETDEYDGDPRHPDPITGQPGAHPVSTGLGAAGAGMIATVAGVALGGPIGGVVGAVVGSVAGGYAGKAVGENMNPTLEDEHWREHHDPESFGGEPYDHYAAAYRSGYEGYGRHGDSRSNFDEAEADIREEYERSGSTIPWDKARGASNAAWDKAAAQKQPGTPMTHPKPGERL